MSGDMPLVLHDIVNSVPGPELRAEWEDECLNLELSNFDLQTSLWALETARVDLKARGSRRQRASRG